MTKWGSSYVVAAAPFVACGGGHDQKLRDRTQSFCHTLTDALERARDGIASGQQLVSPYGDIRSAQLAMFTELGFCASVRSGDTAALVDRFDVASDKADQLLSRPIVELDTASRQALQERLGEMAAVAKAIEAMPLE
jgi:hypothetical protein